MVKFDCKKCYNQLTLAQRWRVYCLAVIIIFLIVIFWLKIVPLGTSVYTKDYGARWRSGKGFIYNFTPQDRVDDDKSNYPRLLGDPVYFSVFTPRTFSQAEVTIIYEDNLGSETPLIEMGVLADPIVWRYNLQPLENKIINNVTDNWSKISQSKLTLWQKESVYQNVDQFLHDLKQQSLINCSSSINNCLATYNYQPEFSTILNQQFQQLENLGLDDSLPLKNINPVALRGDHSLLLFVSDNNPLQINMALQAWSSIKPIKRAEILLFKDKELVASYYWPTTDDKVLTTLNIESSDLNLGDLQLESGVYKLEIKISADVMINQIESNALAAVFMNKIWPVETSDKIRLFTDSQYIQVKAMSPASLQTINFNEEEVLLSSPYQQEERSLAINNPINEIRLEKDNVVIENNGVFSFFPEQIFNPALKKIDRFFMPDPELRYILADYQEPKMEAGEKQATAKFSLIGAYREKGKYNFMLSIPGLQAENNSGNFLVIKKVIITMKGRSLWEKILNLPDRYK